MTIEKYDDISVKAMKDKLKALGVETDKTLKSDVYELYKNTLEGKVEMTETKVDVKTEVEKGIEKIEITETPTKERKSAKEVSPLAYIEVVSLCPHGLTFVAPDGVVYDWERKGDEALIPFKDLRGMVSSKNKAFFTKGLLKVVDEEIAQLLKLEKFYENNLSEEELDVFLNSDLEYLDIHLVNVAKYNRDSIINYVRTHKDTYVDYRKIELIEKKLNIDFKL